MGTLLLLLESGMIVRQVVAALLVGACGWTTIACGADATANTTQPAPITAAERALWVGKFDQCSYDALGSVLAKAIGPAPTFKDRKSFEEVTFQKPLEASGFGAYYGWAPYTAPMVNTGKVVWDAKPVTGVVAERFSLATTDMPKVHGHYDAVVTYRPGERAALCKKLAEKLTQGPVVIWTPYAASITAEEGDTRPEWKHVRHDGETDYVLFDPSYTHAVTIFARPGRPIDEVLVTDCSVRGGVYVTTLENVVSTAAAMSVSVRMKDQSGSSVFSRGLKGVTNDEFDVAFHWKGSAIADGALPLSAEPTTQPGTQPAASLDPSLMNIVPVEYQAHVAASLAMAGNHASTWADVLKEVPTAEREGAAFLIAGMPAADLKTLDKTLFIGHLNAAYTAFNAAPWHAGVPHDVFLQSVLPYANLDEARESWDKPMAEVAQPLVSDATTPGAAALALNGNLFHKVGVQYHPTKRPKPNQSPSESIAAGYASCSGLSILLVDACRSVGVPARVVGTPGWVIARGDANGNHSGNHTWVEVWDNGWHVLGASEKSPLDKTWFLDNARLAATSADPLHHIYASTWKHTDGTFPIIWDLEDHEVAGLDVTAEYAKR